MHIDVKIPFDEKSSLAAAYNRALEESQTDWVLFLDHDVFLANPHWYSMCLEAIRIVGETDPLAACITCVGGGQRHHRLVKSGVKINDSIEYHIEQSRIAYAKHGNALQQSYEGAAGFFLLINRKIAKEIGFRQSRPGNINGVDAWFGNKLLKSGYHIYVMNGLYVYHRRGMKHIKKVFVHDSIN